LDGVIFGVTKVRSYLSSYGESPESMRTTDLLEGDSRELWTVGFSKEIIGGGDVGGQNEV